VLWVSRGPHQLGEYDAYTIEKFGESLARSIRADSALTSGRYEKLLAARALLEDGASEADLRRALELNPNDATALRLLAKALEVAGKRAEAVGHYRAALAAEPPFQEDREAIEKALRRLE